MIKKLLMALVLMPVMPDAFAVSDSIITHAGMYSGVVRSDQDQRFADLTYLVEVPSGMCVHLKIRGVRTAGNTDQQTIAAGITADGVYRLFIFDPSNDWQTSVESRSGLEKR